MLGQVTGSLVNSIFLVPYLFGGHTQFPFVDRPDVFPGNPAVKDIYSSLDPIEDIHMKPISSGVGAELE